jgi:hypothetical protein
MDGGTLIVVLAVWTLAALCLRTAVKSCSTSEYILYRALYSRFPFRSWWRFLLVFAMFWTTGVHFGIPPTDARVDHAKGGKFFSIPRARPTKPSASKYCCLVFSYSSLWGSVRLHQSFWNSWVGTLALIHFTTTITAHHSGRAVWDVKHLHSLERWDLGFESHSRHGYLRLFCLCVR